MPSWDTASQKKIRDALNVLASAMGGFEHAFGSKSDVAPVDYLIGCASGWGGNPHKDASYRIFRTRQERWQNDLQVACAGRCASRRFLVDQRLQRRRILLRRTTSTPIQSTISRRRSRRTARWIFSSGAATVRCPIACLLARVGTMRFACTDLAPKFSMGRGNSRRRSRRGDRRSALIEQSASCRATNHRLLGFLHFDQRNDVGNFPKLVVTPRPSPGYAQLRMDLTKL